jgi:hypothetical protein
LKTLQLNRCRELGPKAEQDNTAFFQSIPSCLPYLTQLALSGSNITNKGLLGVSQSPYLAKLSLNAWSILVALALGPCAMESLQYVDLRQCCYEVLSVVRRLQKKGVSVDCIHKEQEDSRFDSALYDGDGEAASDVDWW